MHPIGMLLVCLLLAYPLNYNGHNDFWTGWWGALGTFMISRPIQQLIAGNLAYGMGDGESTNQHPVWEIWC